MEGDILFEWMFHFMSEKKDIWNWTRMKSFNFNDIFLKTFIQEHKVLQDCTFEPIYFYVCSEICMQHDIFCLDHC